eukprot:763622-Pyramimonas_sp.AAC.1
MMRRRRRRRRRKRRRSPAYQAGFVSTYVSGALALKSWGDGERRRAAIRPVRNERDAAAS